jgi:hypothetical protein
MMLLEETPEALRWLTQFEVPDREVARQLLRRLILVSESEFDAGIQRKVERILDDVGTENVALFPITEPPSPFFREGRRIQGSSSDRIRHLIEGISRVHGRRVRANPTLQSMRAERMRNVILIDDFVGSGTRVTRFWKDVFCQEQIGKSVKSWVSRGWTKLWLVSYAALDEGRAKVRRAIPRMVMRTVLPRRDDRLGFTRPMELIARKYGERLKDDAWFGYGEGGGNLVFQHGCPNNCPAILWAAGRRFSPVFPERGIPSGLHDCFGIRNHLADAESLWTYGQYTLALSLIEHVRQQKANPEDWELVTALAFASTHGAWHGDTLGQQLQMPGDAIGALTRRAYDLHLIDKQTHRLTAFARDLLQRLRRPQRGDRPARKLEVPSLSNLYYPDTCGGVSKH